jgi:hypothetical protein
MNVDPGSSKSNRPPAPPIQPGSAGASPTVFIDWGPALPEGYGRPRVLALVRDPKTFFCSWEGGDRIRARDVGDGSVREQVVEGIGSWYFDGTPEHEYDVELLSGDRTVAVSARVRLPRLDPANSVDPEWTPTPEQEELLRQFLGTLGPFTQEVETPGTSKSWRRRIAGMPVSRPSRSS